MSYHETPTTYHPSPTRYQQHLTIPLPPAELGDTCQVDGECEGDNTICDGVCSCGDGYQENEGVCAPGEIENSKILKHITNFEYHGKRHGT